MAYHYSIVEWYPSVFTTILVNSSTILGVYFASQRPHLLMLVMFMHHAPNIVLQQRLVMQVLSTLDRSPQWFVVYGIIHCLWINMSVTILKSWIYRGPLFGFAIIYSIEMLECSDYHVLLCCAYCVVGFFVYLF